jgi:glucokinase
MLKAGEVDVPSAAPSRHLGLDLGGTLLKWAVVEQSARQWRLVGSGTLPTRADSGALGIAAELVECAVDAAALHGPVRSVGVAVPGRYDAAAGTVRFTPNIHVDWSGVPITRPIEAALGVRAHLVNDARAFTLAELRLGAGRGARCMVGITLGTGVGGGIVIDGRLHAGLDGAAGEIGHQTVDPDGPLCGCGNRGCVESYARADAIAAACGTGTPEEAVDAARAGDPRAAAGLADAGHYLGIAVANLVTLLTPDAVVFGGGVAKAGELLFAPIRAELRARVHMTDPDAVRLLPAELGTLAGAIGSAAYGAEADGPGITGRASSRRQATGGVAAAPERSES